MILSFSLITGTSLLHADDKQAEILNDPQVDTVITFTASVSTETLTQSSAETAARQGDDSIWGATDYKHGFQIFPDKQLPPALKLTDTEGKAHDLQDYRGKVVLLNFWGIHCPPCIKEIPSLENLQKKFSPDDFVVLSANVGEGEEEVMMFLDNFTTGYPVMLDPNGSTLNDWKLQAFPATFIIDRDGYLRLSYSGGLEWDQQGVVDFLAAEMQLQAAN
ncbi:MAG: TlpA family protein disulfide reductase [Gammaproteobacteria bacterium]|nr:TlpA family protein disulfide reductase [Gammaproteobacteria bacterium]